MHFHRRHVSFIFLFIESFVGAKHIIANSFTWGQSSRDSSSAFRMASFLLFFGRTHDSKETVRYQLISVSVFVQKDREHLIISRLAGMSPRKKKQKFTLPAQPWLTILQVLSSGQLSSLMNESKRAMVNKKSKVNKNTVTVIGWHAAC